MPAVTGMYFGLEESRLVAMRDALLAQLDAAREGKRFDSVSGGGKSFTKNHLSAADLRRDLAEIMAALRRIDPDTYGRRTKRILVSFSAS